MLGNCVASATRKSGERFSSFVLRRPASCSINSATPSYCNANPFSFFVCSAIAASHTSSVPYWAGWPGCFRRPIGAALRPIARRRATPLHRCARPWAMPGAWSRRAAAPVARSRPPVQYSSWRRCGRAGLGHGAKALCFLTPHLGCFELSVQARPRPLWSPSMAPSPFCTAPPSSPGWPR